MVVTVPLFILDLAVSNLRFTAKEPILPFLGFKLLSSTMSAPNQEM